MKSVVMKPVVSYLLAVVCLAIPAVASGFGSQDSDPAITLSVVDEPDPFGTTIQVSITDGVDPIPQLALTLHASLVDGTGLAPQVSINALGITDGVDPIPTVGVLAEATVIDDPALSGTVLLHLTFVVKGADPVGVDVVL